MEEAFRARAASATVVTEEELRRHNSDGDAWVAIGGLVFDVSRFAGLHPGGEGVLLRYAGKDATEAFYGLHRADVLDRFGPRLLKGRLEGRDDDDIVDDLTPSRAAVSQVPFAEPAWVRDGWHSPFYSESHHAFRRDLRRFIVQELGPEAAESELAGDSPSEETYLKMGRVGLLASRVGPGPHLSLAPALPGGVSVDEFDYFHEMLTHEEIARLGAPSYTDGCGAGLVIGLPPVLNFGPEWMQSRVVEDVLSGRRRICLAISEPQAGSDVANLTTTAERTADGRFFRVNGVKKWITNGCDAHYFTTAVRTGGRGMGGISLLLIERSEGLETKKITTSYGGCAGTAYVTFEDVLVPVENLLGAENEGFMCIMSNFNHERWMVICYVLAGVRGAIEECFKWTSQRSAFGKPLSAQPVVRQKLAKMVSECESAHSWLESLTHQMCHMGKMEQMMKLASAMSLLKYHCTRVAHDVADDAVQLFGGRGITQNGMGIFIERFQKSYKFGSILGGSEEVMADLGVKLALKNMPANARL